MMQMIVDWLVETSLELREIMDLSKDKQALRRQLKQTAEKAIQLSSLNQINIRYMLIIL